MQRGDIKKYLQTLGHKLQEKQVTGEILVSDDIVMLLDIEQPAEFIVDDFTAVNPQMHEDIDTYFGGRGAAIREAIAEVTKDEDLPDSWLYDTLTDFFYRQPSSQRWLEYPGLHAYIAPTEYLLAMKVAVPGCAQDIEDIKILAEKLNISDAQEMLVHIIKYIPEQLLTPEMHSRVEQTFELQYVLRNHVDGQKRH